MQALIAFGVQAVIDCRAEFDDGQLLASSGLAYLYDPTEDDGQPKPVEWFRNGWVFARGIWITQPTFTVYAHCAAGVHRGPAMCYFLLRASTGDTREEAISLIKQNRPQAEPEFYADSADAALQELFPVS